MRCSACGAEVAEGFRWCGSCGSRVAPAVPTTRPALHVPAEEPTSGDEDVPARGAAASVDLEPTGPHLDVGESPVGRRRTGRSARARLVGAVVLVVLVALVAVQTFVRSPRDLDAVGRGGASFDGAYSADPGPLTGRRLWRRDRPTAAASPAVGRVTVADDRAYVPAGAVLTALDTTDGAVVWRAELPSALAAPPVVVGDVLVVGGDGWVRGLDRGDGRLRWRQPLPGAGPVMVGEQREGTGALVTDDGHVASFTADGRDLGWNIGPRQLAGDGDDRIDGPLHVRVPPVAWSGFLFVTVTPGDGGAGRVVCLEGGTGRVRWRSPVPVRADREVLPLGSVVLAATAEGVVGLDLQTGVPRWLRPLPEASTGPGVVIGATEGRQPLALTAGLVALLDHDSGAVRATADPGNRAAGGAPPATGLLGSGLAVVGNRVVTQDAGRALTARLPGSLEPDWTVGTDIPGPASLTPAGSAVFVGGVDGSLAMVDVGVGGTIRWRTRVVGLDDCPLVGGGDVVYLSVAEHLYAFDAAAGTLDWSYTAPAPLTGGIAAAHGRVAVPDRRGLVHLLAADGGTVVATGVGGDANLGAVVVTDAGRVVVGGGLGFPLPSGEDGYLRALAAEDGQPGWLTYLAGGLAVAPSAVAGIVVAVTDDGHVQALDEASGHVRWTAALGTPPTGSAALSATPASEGGNGPVDGVAVVSDVAGTVRALDLATGGTLWTARMGVPLRRDPAVADGLVVVRADAHTVVAFAAQTGERRWEATVADALTSPPAIAGDRVLVGTMAGVTALDLHTGRPRGRLDRDEPVTAAPVVTQGGIVVCEASGAIESLR